MAIIITQDALTEFSRAYPLGNANSDLYFSLRTRSCTKESDETFPGYTKDNENIVPLHFVNIGARGCAELKAYGQEMYRINPDNPNRMTGYYIKEMDSELDNKQSITGTDLFLTWTDDDHSSLDGATIDFDYVKDIYTIQIP